MKIRNAPQHLLYKHLAVILLISWSWSEVSFAETVIFKCCNNDTTTASVSHAVKQNEAQVQNENFRGEVSLDISKYLRQGAINITNHDLSKSFTITECHKNETKLTEIVSLGPGDETFFEKYSPEEFCVQRASDQVAVVKVEPRSEVFTCDGDGCVSIRKCCNANETFDLQTYGKSKILCVPSPPWDPVVYSYSKEENSWNKDLTSRSSMTFVSNHPRNWCTTGNVVIWSMRPIGNNRKSLFRILNDGSVVKRNGANWEILNSDKICVESAINFPTDAGHIPMRQTVSADELDTIILECDPRLAIQEDAPTILYGTALAISSVFLLATLIIYGLLYDKQSIHGWTLLGLVTTMFIFYVSLIVTYFYLYHYPDANFTDEIEILSSFCGIIAVISHFFWLSWACWLTIICFDIFAKFRILKLTRSNSKNKLKFFIYFLFTMIVPFSIVCTGVVLDITYGDNLNQNFIIPRYGWNKCFLDLRNAAFPYLFGPIGFLLILNCILYLATIFYIYRLQQSTKFASNGANNSQIQKQRAKIRLFSKLFLLMGISWIFEFISFVAFGTNTNIVVIIGDLINILQPIAVFIIFVCKRDILKSLCQKYSTLAKIFSSFEIEEFTPSTSSNSNGVTSGKLTKLWNPVANTRWFRSRINSTMTDTSNVSNQSIRSTLNVIEESPLPSIETSTSASSPLKDEHEKV